MQGIQEAATTFLANKRIAVTGVSRKPAAHGSNAIYRRLRERGYGVFAVNPNASVVEGDPSYRDLAAIPGGVDAVVIATRPELAVEAMQQCLALGIRQVWMHHGAGASSVSAEAAALGRANGITVIDGGCPLMFGGCADLGHRVLRFVYSSRVPKQV